MPTAPPVMVKLSDNTRRISTKAIVAKARKFVASDRTLRKMPSAEWKYYVVGTVDKDGYDLEPCLNHPGGGTFYDRVWLGLSLPRKKVFALWPPIAGAVNGAGQGVPAKRMGSFMPR